jgi:hypothetical protein
MHDQVDGPTTAHAPLPVDKLRALDRQNAIKGMPFVWVVWIGLGLAESQDRGQRNISKAINGLRGLWEDH